jgi:hypothetical protein
MVPAALMTVPLMAALPQWYALEERKLYAMDIRPRAEDVRAGLHMWLAFRRW